MTHETLAKQLEVISLGRGDIDSPAPVPSEIADAVESALRNARMVFLSSDAEYSHKIVAMGAVESALRRLGEAGFPNLAKFYCSSEYVKLFENQTQIQT